MSTFARALARMGATDAHHEGHGCADVDHLTPAPRWATQVDPGELDAWNERNDRARRAYVTHLHEIERGTT